jgi:hypothetical protein
MAVLVVVVFNGVYLPQHHAGMQQSPTLSNVWVMHDEWFTHDVRATHDVWVTHDHVLS